MKVNLEKFICCKVQQRRCLHWSNAIFSED